MTSLPRFSLLLAATLLVSVPARANQAQLIFNCASVRLHPATVKQLGLTYRLEATTAVDTTINDEIGLSENEDTARYYGTVLVLTDPTLFEPLPIYCDLDLPSLPDKNRNAIEDFFEADLAVSNAVSEGEFLLDDGMDVYPGLVTMTWNRSAGSAAGTCRLRFRLPDFGVDLTFQHNFEIYDYRGTLDYTVNGDDRSGVVSLTRLGGNGIYGGPLPLTRVDQEELQFPAFAWTDEAGKALEFFSSADMEISLIRGGMGTNYFTVLGTDDGWPASDTTAEYQIWLLYVFDGHDSDQDGIADLSDDPALPTPPKLAIRTGDKTVLIEVTYEAGRHVVLEQTPTLIPSAWATVADFTLTSASHTVELPAPAGSAFWRAKAD